MCTCVLDMRAPPAGGSLRACLFSRRPMVQKPCFSLPLAGHVIICMAPPKYKFLSTNTTFNTSNLVGVSGIPQRCGCGLVYCNLLLSTFSWLVHTPG